MPTVLRVAGFRFMIYQGDAEHGPPHVHVIKSDTEVVIDLPAVSVREIKGMTNSDVRAAVRQTNQHAALLMDAWRRIND